MYPPPRHFSGTTVPREGLPDDLAALRDAVAAAEAAARQARSDFQDSLPGSETFRDLIAAGKTEQAGKLLADAHRRYAAWHAADHGRVQASKAFAAAVSPDHKRWAAVQRDRALKELEAYLVGQPRSFGDDPAAQLLRLEAMVEADRLRKVFWTRQRAMLALHGPLLGGSPVSDTPLRVDSRESHAWPLRELSVKACEAAERLSGSDWSGNLSLAARRAKDVAGVAFR